MGVQFFQENLLTEERRSSFSMLELSSRYWTGEKRKCRLVGNVLRRNVACIQGRSFIYFQSLPPTVPCAISSFLSSSLPSASVPRWNLVERPIFVKSGSPNDDKPEYRTRMRFLLFLKARYFDTSMYLVSLRVGKYAIFLCIPRKIINSKIFIICFIILIY